MNTPDGRVRNAAGAVIAALALTAAVVVAWQTPAVETPVPVYFRDSRLVVRTVTVNQIRYFPVDDFLRHMGLAFTDSTELETLTVRSGNSRLVLTRNSATMSLNNQIALLRNPVLRENGRWLVPPEFLTSALNRLTGTEFRLRPGLRRIYSGVEAPELAMAAQPQGNATRLTIRTGTATTIAIQRAAGRTVVTFDRSPLEPLRESVDYTDRNVRAIRFDDTDGTARIVVETAADVNEVRTSSLDDNRVHFVDFSHAETVTITLSPEPTGPATDPSPPRPDAPQRRPRRTGLVIVVDAGHGGSDAGARGEGATEKDVALELARRCRTILQSRMGATVILTRDSDADMSNESRAMTANNNHADLFISIHAGHSPDHRANESPIFTMPDGFAAWAGATDRLAERLFVPWFLGHRMALPRSRDLAAALQTELSAAVPGWQFPLRRAPLSVLTSPAMPAVLIEFGNLNNPLTRQSLSDAAFQGKLAGAVMDAISRFRSAESQNP